MTFRIQAEQAVARIERDALEAHPDHQAFRLAKEAGALRAEYLWLASVADAHARKPAADRIPAAIDADDAGEILDALKASLERRYGDTQPPAWERVEHLLQRLETALDALGQATYIHDPDDAEAYHEQAA